jgi:hypothetical protein
MSTLSITCYKIHRCRDALFNHGLWLHERFCLSDRDVEKLLCVRGGIVSHEAIRQWCRQPRRYLSGS